MLVIAVSATFAQEAFVKYEWDKFGAGFELRDGIQVGNNDAYEFTFSGAGIQVGKFYPLDYNDLKSVSIDKYINFLNTEVFQWYYDDFVLDKMQVKNASDAFVAKGDRGQCYLAIFINDVTKRAFCLRLNFYATHEKFAKEVLNSVYFK